MALRLAAASLKFVGIGSSLVKPILSMILVMASFIDLPSLTNGVSSGGVTLFVKGSLVLVETRGSPLCLECLLYSAYKSLSVVPGLVNLVASACLSKLASVRNSLECCNAFIASQVSCLLG